MESRRYTIVLNCEACNLDVVGNLDTPDYRGRPCPVCGQTMRCVTIEEQTDSASKIRTAIRANFPPAH